MTHFSVSRTLLPNGNRSPIDGLRRILSQHASGITPAGIQSSSECIKISFWPVLCPRPRSWSLRCFLWLPSRLGDHHLFMPFPSTPTALLRLTKIYTDAGMDLPKWVYRQKSALLQW